MSCSVFLFHVYDRGHPDCSCGECYSVVFACEACSRDFADPGKGVEVADPCVEVDEECDFCGEPSDGLRYSRGGGG